MHRADQIVDAAVAALQANTNLKANVYPHRILSLSESDGELPAVGITYGDDSPADPQPLAGLLYSALSLQVTAYAVGDDEEEVRRLLLELRAQTHVSMMTNTRLGLSFVHHTYYGGATAPQLDRGERMAGYLISTWRVRYEMNFTDPT